TLCMKKTFFLLMAASAVFVGCQKNTTTDFISDQVIENASTGRQCASQEVYEQQLKADPTRAQRMQAIEDFTQQAIRENAGRLVNGVIEIPVVVNVLYRTTTQDISLTQINSQIAVLNADFAATNTDYNNTPTVFQSLRSGNTNIRFVLSQVIRKSTTKTSWSTNNAMKISSQGGLNPTTPTTHLNIWVCNLSNGILGYAQFPGGASATDGVVIDDNAFGTTGTATAPFNKGRTATHEVGHWANLRHIWGDATCGSDLVNDTPLHNTANYGCPAAGHRSTCTGTPVEMTMNYMDYTDDACMYMFSLGQSARMKAVFAVGGPRNSFAQP
ncbi:MAG: zinc metalloprotease, partial [Ferruginibacter sp.]